MSDTETADPVVRMVTRDNCPFCKMARDWFKARGIECSDEIINDPVARNEFYDREGLIGGQRTVPQIWIDDSRVGGWSDLQRTEYFKSR